MLLREHVSRNAAGKGRAVLEGLLCGSAPIEACFKANPLDEEGAVQAGIVKWIDGTGRQPPTWETLLKAMNYARIAQQHIQSLKVDLGISQVNTCLTETFICTPSYVRSNALACIHATVQLVYTVGINHIVHMYVMHSSHTQAMDALTGPTSRDQRTH